MENMEHVVVGKNTRSAPQTEMVYQKWGSNMIPKLRFVEVPAKDRENGDNTPQSQ